MSVHNGRRRQKGWSQWHILWTDPQIGPTYQSDEIFVNCRAATKKRVGDMLSTKKRRPTIRQRMSVGLNRFLDKHFKAASVIAAGHVVAGYSPTNFTN